MVKLYGIEVCLNRYILEYAEIECKCGYFLGLAKKSDLVPTGEPMFECPKCFSKFDFILKD